MDASSRRPMDPDTESANGKPLLIERGLILYATVILMVGWAISARQIYIDRQLSLRSSQDQLTLSATAFENHVTAMIHDGVGAAIAGSNAVRAEHQAHDITQQDMASMLANMLTGGRYVHSLFIVTPTMYGAALRIDANFSASGPNASQPQQDLSFITARVERSLVRPRWTQAIFKSDVRAVATWVGQPIIAGNGDADVLVPIARKVADLNGEETWAGAVLSFSELNALYQKLPIAYGDFALLHDNRLLLRVPSLTERQIVGVDFGNRTFTNEYPQTSTVTRSFEAADPISGHVRQFAVRRFSDYPLYAAAGRDVDMSLLEWRTRTRNSILMIAAASVSLMGMTVLLYVLLKRRFVSLKNSEQRFQLAVAGSNSGIWDWDAASNYTYYSPRLKEILGVGPNEDFPATPESYYSRMHADDVDHIQDEVRRHILNRTPYDVEYRVQVAPGEYRWVHARAQANWNEQGRVVRMSGSIVDVHDKHMAEASLEQARIAELHAHEEFAQDLLLAQEQERTRLANELHDSVGQILSLIKNRALMILRQPNLSAEATPHVTSISELASEVIAEVRTVAQNLRPLHIEELGITDAINTLIKRVADSSGLAIRSRVENVDDVLQGTAATHLYRIVQELLNNVLKHAQAKAINLELERDLHCVRLVVTDDGIGYNADNRPVRGLGLASIAERTRMLHATFQVTSSLGVGTRMRIEIPIVESNVDQTASAS